MNIEFSDDVQRELQELREDMEEQHDGIKGQLYFIFAFLLLIRSWQTDDGLLFVLAVFAGILAVVMNAVHFFQSWKRFKSKSDKSKTKA